MEELWRFQVRILLLERNIRVRLDSVMLVYRAGIKCREGNQLFIKEKHFEGNLMCVFVSVRVCACSGIVFHRCRKHTYTDDCHSNRSGGRRKLWCSWVIFSWTLCSLQHESFSKLYKNFSNEKKKSQVASLGKLLGFPHLPRSQMTPPVCFWGEDAAWMWDRIAKDSYWSQSAVRWQFCTDAQAKSWGNKLKRRTAELQSPIRDRDTLINRC